MSDAKTILIVDDEPDARVFTQAMLSELDDVTTLTANDGDSGLAKAREVVQDLIILDVQMPGKSGFDVFSELKKDETTKAIPVIMLTGVEEKTGIGFNAKDMEDFLGGAPAAYLEKPIDPQALQQAASTALGL